MALITDIIDRCGGNKAVADWLGLDRSAVQRWGYANRIPAKHWAGLIAAAARAGVTITVDELLPPGVPVAANRKRTPRQASSEAA